MEWGQLIKVELSGYKSIKEMSLSLSNLNVMYIMSRLTNSILT